MYRIDETLQDAGWLLVGWLEEVLDGLRKGRLIMSMRILISYNSSTNIKVCNTVRM